jgi:hypothetical protein
MHTCQSAHRTSKLTLIALNFLLYFFFILILIRLSIEFLKRTNFVNYDNPIWSHSSLDTLSHSFFFFHSIVTLCMLQLSNIVELCFFHFMFYCWINKIVGSYSHKSAYKPRIPPRKLCVCVYVKNEFCRWWVVSCKYHK